jgi:hypothetical protein
MSTATEWHYFFLDRQADMGIAVGTLAETSESATFAITGRKKEPGFETPSNCRSDSSSTCVTASPRVTNFARGRLASSVPT